jgi:competence protein ComEA
MTTDAGSRPLRSEPGRSRSRAAGRPQRLRLLEEQLAARFGIAPRAVLGLVLVALAVVAVLGVRLLLARHDAAVVPVAPQVVSSAATAPTGQGARQSAAAGAGSASLPAARPARQGPGASQVPGAATATSGTGAVLSERASGEVVVHVVGRVRHAGVVRLPAGARVEQALAAAGGPRRDADLTRLNLARVLVDGEQVWVPRPGEANGPDVVGPVGFPVGSGPGGSGSRGGGSGSAGAALAPVNINTATLADLDTLPGVGPVLAQRIVDWRTQNGRFTSVDELGEVSGIGDAVLARLRPLVRL